MNNGPYLTNQFLIAMPGMEDRNFSKTVTYICEHTREGAMGIVLNRPTDLHLSNILEQMEITEIDLKQGEESIYLGGPVQPDRGFVLHDDDRRWESTLPITPKISITTSRDILEAIAAGSGPEHYLIALGYAGWSSGQLEAEISTNTWLNGPAEPEILFQLAVEKRWRAAAQLLGVDINLLSNVAGHA